MNEKLRLLRKELLTRHCVQHNLTRIIDEYSPPIDYIKNQMALEMGHYLSDKEIMKFEDVEIHEGFNKGNHQLFGTVYAMDKQTLFAIIESAFLAGVDEGRNND